MSATPARRLRASGRSALGLLAAAVLAIGVNMLADRLLPRARVDLTEQRLYTLSDGTRQVLAGLKDPITLRLFYSRRLGAEIPVYGAYADRVREMLSEYAALSNGKVKLEVSTPSPSPRSRTAPWPRPAGRAGRPVRRAGLFRPRRHQSGGRRADGRLLPAGPRALPRIRPHAAGLRPVQPDPPGDRA